MNTEIQKKADEPVAKFAKKEDVYVPAGIMQEMKVVIPPIFYWEDVVDEKSVLMTMAFLWRGNPYGMSYPIEDENVVKKNMLRQKLFLVVKESLDVLIHHGVEVVDMFGNIDPTRVNDQEAIRWKHDPYWHKRVAAFNKLVRVVPITKKKAKELKLL